jgi:DNA repair exonuclease SbcCD ATPase subunit
MITTEIIKKNKLWKYDKIYHISDIHIRNTEEHISIYSHVFENLYKYLHTVKSDKSLIVITGDILHNKNRLTTICETLCVDFFEKLSSMMTTIIIPGNHDFNEKANTIEDSLSTILYKREFDNLHYLKLSGVYRFNNILFGVSSLIDNKIIKASDISESGLKICLYHGAVSNSKNSKGFEFSNKSMTNFDGYDLVLLGDIHYFQYLNEEKTMAYASSLISQNFSETDLNHGVLVWDLNTKESFYKPIPNDYRYDEIDIKNNKLIYKNKKILFENLELPPNGKLKINSLNSDIEFYNKTVFDIKNTYPNLNIVHNKLLTNNLPLQNKTKETNVITIESIVDKEIEKLPETSKKYVEKVLLKEIKSAIQSVDEKLNWRLLSLEFSNMFSYGPNNCIDFTKLTFDEITGLFGPNSIGKSSLIDILLFSLYDDYSRNYQEKHKLLSGTIINTKEKIFSCKVSFSIDNTIYFIEKEGKRLGAKTEHTFDTFKFINYDFYKMESNNKVQLNGHDRIETLEKIKKLIGEYNDFCVSSVCLQSNNRDKVDFFNMSSCEKKVFLNNRLKFDIFKNIELKYKDLLKETKINLKNIEKLDEYQNYNHNTDNKLVELELAIKNYNQEKNQLDDQQQINNEQLNKLYKQLKPVDDSLDCEILDKQQIENDIKLFSNKLSKFNSTDFDNQIEELYNANLNLTSKLTSSDNDFDFDELIDEKTKITNKISSIKLNLSKLNLIKNKFKIIESNTIFEKQKMEKIILLSNKINFELNLSPKNKFSKKILENWNLIFAQIIIPNFDSEINKSKITILNLQNTINQIFNTIGNIKNIIKKYDDIIDDKVIKNIYDNINYDEYINNMITYIADYDEYYELNKIIETNDDIFTLLNDFNKCINKSCSNCLKHSNGIVQLFSKLNINKECNFIKNKFNELKKAKIEFEQIIVYHNKLKLNNSNQLLDLFKSALEYEQSNLAKLLEQQNDKTSNDFKLFLQDNIYKLEQNNYTVELNKINSMVNDEYQMLLVQIEQADIYNKQIENLEIELNNINKQIENYEKDKQIILQLNFNKNKISELKSWKTKYKIICEELSELKYKLENINGFEYNVEIYKQINNTKKTNQIITQNIINTNNDFANNNHEYKQLKANKQNYIKFIEQINGYNSLIDVYENIIKITGPKGIPRQIINIKLQQIEDMVNDIILPFVNKQINITKEIDDIKIFINDGVSKYYSSGGMENFIISLAFKIAFTNTFNIPNTGILFIDEGVSVLDKNHANNFSVIATFIKKYYNHIILITHIDTFYDYTFDIINITKNKNKQSFINYNDNIIKDEQNNTPANNSVQLNKPKQSKLSKKTKQLEIEV